MAVPQWGPGPGISVFPAKPRADGGNGVDQAANELPADRTADHPERVGASLPRACTASFWIGRQLEHGEPLIRPWLYAGQSYMIWGKRGSGKSQTLLSTVFAGATGTPFGKWAPTKKVRTAFFDFEMSQFDLQMRIGEMVEHFGDPGENLIAISTIDFPQIHPLDTPAKAKYFLAILDDFKPDIIAIDNIQACVSQSIKSGDAFTALKPVNAAIRERQMCAIWGHHAGFSDDHHYGDSQIDWGTAGTMKTEKGLSLRLRRPRNVVTRRVGQDRTYSERPILKVRHDRRSALAHRVSGRLSK